MDRKAGRIEAHLRYPVYNFEYRIGIEAREGGIVISVNLERPLPEVLEGKAGFNIEFLPSAYFKKAYLMDGRSGYFPLYPGGPMESERPGRVEPKPIASGASLVLAPEDPARAVFESGSSVGTDASSVGCSIARVRHHTVTPGGLWDAGTFEVRAVVTRDGTPFAEIPLAYAGETSVFRGLLRLKTPGTYEIMVEGRKYPARAHLKSPYDPRNQRPKM